MQKSRYYVGLDVSTQGAKLLVLDYDRRAVVFTTAVSYDQDLPAYSTVAGARSGQPPGVSESDPRMWIDAVDILFARFKASGIDGQQVGAIAVSGQQHGLVCLDAAGQLTRPYAKLWNDVSTVKECQQLTDAVGGPAAMLHEVGNTQKPGYTAGKIVHFKHEDAAAFARTTTFFLVHNYINFYLTGGVRVMEPGDASGMALWHPGRQAFAAAVLNAIDPTLRAKLPEVKPATACIGPIAGPLAAKYGLARECMIDAGSGDNMYGAIGTANITPGVITVSLGTSGTAYGFSHEYVASLDGEVAAFCDATGYHLPLVCINNLAGGYNQFLHQHGLSHGQFAELLQQTPKGNQGRILVPWFIGERTPDLPYAAPLTLGFQLADFANLAVMARAVVEGHVLNLHSAYQKLPVQAASIHLTGGLAKSAAFRQAIADIFQAEVIPVEGEGAALGAALHAAWLQRGGSLADLVRDVVVFDESCRTRPDPAAARTYDQLRKLYSHLTARLATQNPLYQEDLFKQFALLR